MYCTNFELRVKKYLFSKTDVVQGVILNGVAHTLNLQLGSTSLDANNPNYLLRHQVNSFVAPKNYQVTNCPYSCFSAGLVELKTIFLYRLIRNILFCGSPSLLSTLNLYFLQAQLSRSMSEYVNGHVKAVSEIAQFVNQNIWNGWYQIIFCSCHYEWW